MLNENFPSSLNKIEKIEYGLFVRSEIDEKVNSPVAKKAKIDETFEQKENEIPSPKHVKFSSAPPMEYSTFPDSEYDRSSLNIPAGH